MTPLHHAVESKSIEMIQLLIRKGASVNSTTFGGGTALHFASGYALLDAIKILLASGANSKVSNVEGDTPADVAPTARVSHHPNSQLISYCILLSIQSVVTASDVLKSICYPKIPPHCVFSP